MYNRPIESEGVGSLRQEHRRQRTVGHLFRQLGRRTSIEYELVFCAIQKGIQSYLNKHAD